MRENFLFLAFSRVHTLGEILNWLCCGEKPEGGSSKLRVSHSLLVFVGFLRYLIFWLIGNFEVFLLEFKNLRIFLCQYLLLVVLHVSA